MSDGAKLFSIGVICTLLTATWLAMTVVITHGFTASVSKADDLFVIFCFPTIYYYCVCSTAISIFSSEPRNESYRAYPIEVDLEYQSYLNRTYIDKYQACVVCLDNVKSTRLNCGHAILCHTCAHRVKQHYKACPLCGTEIVEVQENFLSTCEWVPSSEL